MAGRLGVLRRLVGEEGSLLVAVQLEDAKAESLRSSSSASSVLFRAEALGPGEVRGRRTLLSQPRVAGPFNAGLVGLESAGAGARLGGGVEGAEGVGGALGADVVATRALPEVSAASSLIATRGTASSHQTGPRK
jgi:hypothetical protein